MKKIILASNSYRRKELLSHLGFEFTVEASDIVENFDRGLSPADLIKQISYEKGKCILDKHPDSIIISGDTAVSYDNLILGKPERDLLTKYGSDKFYELMKKDDTVKKEAYKAAYDMLKKLSGSTHEVLTGICIMSSKRKYLDLSVTKVTFSELGDDEIYEYIDSLEPFGKAGGYAAQENAGKFIKRIDGDFFTVVGFPLNMVYEELKNIDLY